MLGSAEVARAVRRFLEMLEDRCPVVLDPILRATSRARLLEARGLPELRRMIPLATVITPNLAEAGALAGMRVNNLEQMRSAARRLHRLGASNVVITGGHLRQPVDLVSMDLGGDRWRQIEFRGKRVPGVSTHGTGCAFATALAARLARGRPLEKAVAESKQYVAVALGRARPLGRGAKLLGPFLPWP